MVEFLVVFISLLSAVFFVGFLMFLTALALTYVYKLSKLVLNDTWSTIVTLAMAVILITFYFSVGVYFGEVPL